MARVNLDGKVWKDPRVKRLAKGCGWSMRETVGTLAAIWDVAYDAKSVHMRRDDIDTVAELDGFADRMCHESIQLADDTDDPDVVRLHGVDERIAFLLTQAERGRMGGAAKAASKSSAPNKRVANAKRVLSERQANAKRTLSTGLAQLQRTPSLPLAPDLDLPLPLPLPLPPDLDPDLDRRVSAAPPSHPARKGKSKATDYSPEELASVRAVLDRIGRSNGVAYQGSDKHTRLIANQLRKGVTEMELRWVVAYCAEELGWETDERMRSYLRPETLFGPECIDRYLDPSRAYSASQTALRESQRPSPQPALRLVPDGGGEGDFDFSNPRWEEPGWMTSQTPR